MGLSAAQLSKAFGARTVIVVDRIASRLEMAKELGADVVIDASREDPVKKILELTSEGVDVGFEMAGHNPVTGVQVLECIKVGDRAHFTGENTQLPINPSRHIVHKQ